MYWVRTVVGGITTAVLTLAMFAGAPLLALVGAFEPVFAVYTVEDRLATYMDEVGDHGEVVESTWVLEPEPEPEPEPRISESPRKPGAADVAEAASAADPSDATERGADARTATKARTRGRRCTPETIPEISKDAKATWTVERDLVQYYARNLKRLDSLGWSRTHRGADGKADGMTIGGVRCNNDLHRAGIRSGDVVHAVNGHPVRNLVQALFVYGKVRKDPEVRVEITRRGQRRILTYRLMG